MRAEPRMFLMDTVVPWVINTERYLGRLDSLVAGPVYPHWMADRLLHSPCRFRCRWRTDVRRRHTVRRVQGARQGCLVRDICACHDGRCPVGCCCSGWTYTSLCRSGVQGLDTGNVGLRYDTYEPADGDPGHASSIGGIDARDHVSSTLRVVADAALCRIHIEAREALE